MTTTPIHDVPYYEQNATQTHSWTCSWSNSCSNFVLWSLFGTGCLESISGTAHVVASFVESEGVLRTGYEVSDALFSAVQAGSACACLLLKEQESKPIPSPVRKILYGIALTGVVETTIGIFHCIFGDPLRGGFKIGFGCTEIVGSLVYLKLNSQTQTAPPVVPEEVELQSMYETLE